ncbi:MAG: hypothetical protein E4H36_04180 [Spirochaetales bacterium]|nr:MAG: hypothetical protein E4H36_04180 [Spirochaetales bacterium]
MTKKIFFVFLILVFLSILSLPADEISDLLKLLDNNAYSVHVIARVIQQNDVSVWDMEITKLTISGKTITVRLNGDNLRATAELTPYKQSDNSILLVAQGQVWITSPGDQNAKYSSTIQSLPIRAGDKVYFYPLGVSKKEKEPPFSIELEIQVTPYEVAVQKGKQ